MPNSKAERRQGPRLFTVTDTSATSSNQKRVHDIFVDGKVKQVEFSYARATTMPFAEAMKFQKEGFIVHDEEGLLVPRPSESTVESIAQFGPDKVIADLGELTREALYSRAAVLSGGEKFSPGSPKDTLIDFIKESASKKIAANTRPDPEVEDIDEGDLDKMGLAAE